MLHVNTLSIDLIPLVTRLSEPDSQLIRIYALGIQYYPYRVLTKKSYDSLKYRRDFKSHPQLNH
jgi:hypothetical protein